MPRRPTGWCASSNRRKFADRFPWYIKAQDLFQEGVMRLLEPSGHPQYQGRKFMFFKACGFMAT
jgi:hypothetical protein